MTAKNQHPHPYRNFANFSDAPITMGGIEIIGAIDDHAETVADAIDRQTAAIDRQTATIDRLLRALIYGQGLPEETASPNRMIKGAKDADKEWP